MSAACATSDAEVGFPAAGHSGDGMDVAGTGGSDEAGSGGDDGLGGGENAGQAAPAGTGGSKAGAGGAGAGGVSGTGASGTGAGGAGAGGTGSAGSGGAGGQPAAGSGGSGGSCDTEYTTASHIMMNVTWPGTIGVNQGSGVVHIWTKTKWSENGNSATLESMSCGSVLPEIQATTLGGGKKILPEIPNAAWDNANMPKFMGSATKSGSTVTVNPGVALVGLTMANPSGSWPSKGSDVTGVDHDGDTKLGITAIPKDGGDYGAPPVAALSSNKADKLYLATRNIMTLTSTNTTECPDTWSGTANVTKFDSHVIGCHVKGGGECTASQAKFVDDNRTVYTVGSATFTAKIVPDNATCADVRAALPMN